MEDSSRNHTVDIFRLIASFFIVFLHVGFESMNENLVALIRISGRWGVPFFFLVSGYFFQKGLLRSPSKTTWKNCLRIFNILIVADIVYIIALYVFDGHFNWSHILLGAYFHLWFLPSLAMGSIVLYFIHKYKIPYALSLGLSSVIICIVLFTDPYSTMLHLRTQSISGHVIPLLSIPYMIIGTYFYQRPAFKKLMRKRIGLGLLILGFILQALEVKLINVYTSRSMVEHQYLIGTLFMSIGAFIMAFSFHFKNDILGRWGKEFSLFIYLYHPLVILFLYHTRYKLIFHGNIVVFFPVVVFILTLLSAILIHRYLYTIFLLATGSVGEVFQRNAAKPAKSGH